VAVAAVLALAAVNYRGVTRTARLSRLLVCVVLIVLAGVAAAGFTAADPAHLTGWADPTGGWYGVLQSAGLLFFAFAGYARIATMGEEVRAPERTIPRAILLALGVAVSAYAVVGVAALLALGPDRLADAAAPLTATARAAGWDWAAPAVAVGAAAAALGALLALIAGVGRTVLAMARERDLPGWLASVHPRYRVPHRAEVALAAVVCALVLVVDLRGAIGFSSFGVLVYYLVANLSALRDPDRRGWRPRVVPVLGAVGCVVLAVTLPAGAVLGGLALFVVGAVYRIARRAVARRASR
jgi:APA family basic amino acid/polyamine antiporter